MFAPLNDYTATVIGMVRDDVAFNTALSADILYTVNAGGLPAVSATSNDHYAQRRDQRRQPEDGAEADDAVADLRHSGRRRPRASSPRAPRREAFFIDGTNRAMFRFTMINHMCRDMEQVLDTTLPPDRIRQDVARSPGGDSRIFLNNCIGCHSGMDPMAQAFAYYDFDDDRRASASSTPPGTVQPEVLHQPHNFTPGFVTPDDNWENRWRHGQNSLLGWSGALPGNGAGAKSMGEELANSHAFAQCQVEKVFKAVCFRAPQATMPTAPRSRTIT